jgi:peptidoglycan hydrolase-like protein with peptidoglycan-binding domain
MEAGLSEREVRFVQAALALLQHNDLTIDGIMGDQTKEAIRQFQVMHRGGWINKIRPTGIADEPTVNAMLEELHDWNKSHNWVHPDD